MTLLRAKCSPSRSRFVTQTAAGSSCILGLIALIGWWANIAALKYVVPGSSPLKPNIAAGFLLCGTALSLLAYKKRRKAISVFATALAVAVVILGALTLGEHFFDWDLGVDGWLVRGFPIVIGNSHPGRMMPTTAFCFVVTGIALFAVGQSITARFRFPLAAGLSASLVIIGVLALGGFLLEMLFGPRWNLLGMSISGVTAAVGFMILGNGLLALLQSEGGLSWFLNSLTSAGFALGILLMVVTAASGFTFAGQMMKMSKSINDRQEVLKEVQACMTGVAELASSERAYTIIGDDSLLKEREQTKNAMNANLGDVRKLTAQNPNQQRRLDRLENLIGQRVDFEDKVIAARRQQGRTLAEQMIATRTGLGLSNEIVGVFKQMQDEEYGLLGADRKQAEMASIATFSLLPLGVFLSLGILSLGVFFLNSGMGEQKKSELDLRQSEERTRAILDSALDCVITMDHRGRVIEFNPAAEKTFGYRRDEAIGQLLSDLIIPPALRERHQKGLAHYLATGEASVLGKRLELTAVRCDESEFPVELAIVRIAQEPPVFTGFIRDITERKRSEDALKATEEKYRSIFENAVEGIFQTTPDGKYLSVNPALARMYGYETPEELAESVNDIGRSVYVDPARRVEFKRLIDAQGFVKLFEYEVYRKDGRKIWLCENARVVREANGNVLYYEGTVEEITTRKRAEDALRLSEAQLRSLIEQAPAAIAMFDREMVYLASSGSWLKHYGAGRSNVVGLSHYDLLPDMPYRWREIHRRGLAGEKQKCDDDLWIRADGSKHWLQWAVQPWVDVHGEIGGITIFAENITERKQADERLREQADIINRAQDAIIIRNFEDANITFWNKGAEHLYGWSAQEAVGKSIGEVIFADETERAALLKTLISTGEFRGELKQKAKDGRQLIVNCRATLIRNEDGAPRSVLLINTDVTEQKKLETQLLRSQRLETIGTLASGVAHDLNNILTPILMGAQTLHGQLDPEDRQSAISLIEDSARRGAGVVKQVLTFARGVEGERVLIKPNHLIEEMIDIARKTFPKSIEVRSNYPENLHPIEGDPTQLHQVLLNLSVNARDAMPDGGSLTFGAENFNVDEHYAAMTPDANAGPYVCLSATDTGAGMPRTTIDRIFDPFFTTKEVGKGTGLGLSTALGIVKSHGGFISVYSEPRRGTTFKIFLPATVADEEVSQSKTVAAPLQGNGEQILIVDDEPNILRITRMIFEKYNYRVLSANDGPEALAIFAQQMPAIGGVLTDVAMPYMDGIALVRALKKMKFDVPIIASTGQGDQAGMAELQSLGVKNFLTKPYNTEKLLETVKTAIETEPAL